jgi:hypothetical protein
MLKGFDLKKKQMYNERYMIAHFMNGNTFAFNIPYDLREDVTIEGFEMTYKKPDSDIKKKEYYLENNIIHAFYDIDNVNPKIIGTQKEKNQVWAIYALEQPTITQFIEDLKALDNESEQMILDNEDKITLEDTSKDYMGSAVDDSTERITVMHPKEYYSNDHRMPYIEIRQMPDKQPLLNNLKLTDILIIIGVVLLVAVLIVLGIVFKANLFG